MTKENYEQLKKEIIKAVPEIVELKMGCKLFIQNYAHSLILIENREDYTNIKGNNLMFSAYYNGDELQRFGKKHITKILGRPIQLDDILIALSDNNIVTELGIFIDIMGRFWKIEPCYGKNKMRIIKRWQLNKDLDWHWENKKETVEYLYNLICK